jgi:hypothetical protein
MSEFENNLFNQEDEEKCLKNYNGVEEQEEQFNLTDDEK